MWTLWIVSALAAPPQQDCSELEGEAKASCVREARRASLEKQMTDLGACKQEVIAERAQCLQEKANLAQRIADLYLNVVEEEVPAKRRSRGAKTTDSTSLEMDIEDE